MNLDDINQAWQVFQGILTANGFQAYLKAGLAGLYVLVGLLFWYLKIFYAREQRELDTQKAKQESEKKQLENLAKLQFDAITALHANIEAMDKQDYEHYLAWIRSKEFYKVLLKVPREIQATIAQFMYDDSITAESRASRILLAIKEK